MNHPMRILHVFSGLDCGGAENFIMNIYREVDRSKIQFDFVVHADKNFYFSDEISQLGGKIYTAPKFTGINIGEYKKWWKSFLRSHKEEYKIIHAHMTSTVSLYIDYAHQNKIKVISHSHSGSYRGNFLERSYKAILTKPIASKADYLFSCSEMAGISKYGKKGIHRKNYYEIKNSINVGKYVFDCELRETVRKELGIENNIVFGHVGSFTEPKNHMYLLEIFSEIRKLCSKAKLVIAGDGPLKEKIEDKISELGTERDVILLGVRSDTNRIFMAMDLLLFPSFFEGLSVTVIEAQATGLRCIVSDKISKEHKITDLVQFESIEKPALYWAKRALEMSEGYERKSMVAEIDKQGYNAKSTAAWLSDFYKRVINIE